MYMQVMVIHTGMLLISDSTVNEAEISSEQNWSGILS
jgi:hypothetical protein